MKRITFKQGLVYLLIALMIGAWIFISWASNAMPAGAEALQALESNAQVTVNQDNGLITFQPSDIQSDVGFIFYPGGRVDYRAYAPVLSQIAARGYFVALVPVPLNLAFFNSGAADQVMELIPDIETWVVGGHSLGGVAAATFASNRPDGVAGLVLWASYPADDSLRASPIPVISIYGSKDMAGMEPFEKSRTQLPADTEFIVIEGGNHSQFGDYGSQPGDNAASISSEKQWTQIVDATVRFLGSLSE